MSSTTVSHTPCVLGFAGQSLALSTSSWYDSHIGGHPVWPGAHSPSSPKDGIESPLPTIPPCPRCGQSRLLLLQAFAPRPPHPNRFVLLFACNDIACSQHPDSFLAWRVCERPSQPNLSTATASLPAGSRVVKERDNTAGKDCIDWDDDDDDDDGRINDGRSSESSDKDITDKLELLSLRSLRATNTKGTSKCNHSPSPRVQSKTSDRCTKTVSTAPSFPSYNLEVDYEPLKKSRTKPSHNHPHPTSTEERGDDDDDDGDDDTASINRLLQQYLSEEKAHSQKHGRENWVSERDDSDAKDTPTLSRLALHNYRETLTLSPRQLLRYAYNTQPLWPSHPSPPPRLTPPCTCGSPIVFEYQLLSTILHTLRVDAHRAKGQRNSGLNFATVAIYTCASDCTTSPALAITSTFTAYTQKVQLCRDDW